MEAAAAAALATAVVAALVTACRGAALVTITAPAPCDPSLPAIPRGTNLPNGSFQAADGLLYAPGAAWPHCGAARARVPACDTPGDPVPPGGVLDVDGTLTDSNGTAWAPGTFWTDADTNTVLSCPCDRIPCVFKCCGEGLMMRLNDTLCVDEVGYNRTESEESDVLKGFNFFSKDPCLEYGKYILDPSDPGDAFSFSENGILQVGGHLLYPKGQFCVEQVVSQPGVWQAFVCFTTPEDEPIASTNMIFYPLFMLVSEPFLAATFFVYAAVPELRNLHGLVIMSHVATLFFAYLTLVIVQLAATSMPYNGCILSAFIIYFAFLASFFWLNVMCLDIWWTFSGFRPMRGSVKEREHKKFIIYSLYCWGSPLIMLIICMVMDLHPDIPDSYIKPGFGELKCWFKSNLGNFIYFSGPIAILIVCNIILFILTAVKIQQVKRGTKILKKQDSRRHNEEEENNAQRFNLYFKLFLVMGVNWIMEIVSFAAGGPDEFWYVTDIANTLQGVLIFIIFVWKDRIRKLLMERFCPGRAANTNSLNNSSSTRTTGIRHNGSVMSSHRPSFKNKDDYQMKTLTSPSARSDDSDVA
ncbi:hypothetical protein R5R35_007149 [Gryllus longicercus]|uniref:G-protein coupled receptors family 2 profile 2 domain-containing protein n=1 Tax=Gryllus longicercus TaxID=2509291 RepID=A0AAN9VGN3_9ORTH